MLRVAMLFIVVGGFLIGVGFLGTPKTKETPPKACWYVSAKTLNIREKPSLESAIWGVLQKNTKICEYWGVQNGFLQISRGWVAMDYLSSNPIPNPKIQEKLAFENKKIVLRSHLKEENKDSLKEAREYFANSDYRAAKNLALRANYENPKNPESWEIFTKSLYLEGKKQEAISILEKFLQTQYDENLFNLLEKMQGDKI
ncbi:SH3 domain-containing protein [Helicobacter pullorum]|uniref:SH3 domain-containing protein n=1 Tax=Helicobacter pullorum TaxID=35818 RepID=UPI00241D158B|nr:SH3 domain-containing protein [Helicobacter pullorum]